MFEFLSGIFLLNRRPSRLKAFVFGVFICFTTIFVKALVNNQMQLQLIFSSEVLNSAVLSLACFSIRALFFFISCS